MGCPRSGTTLVARILEAHSQVAVYFETNYYLIFRPDLHLYGDLDQASNLKRLITDFLEAIRLQGVTPPEMDEFQKALVAPTFEGVLTTFLHLYARQQGKIRCGEKTPFHYLYLREILEKFPHSPVIYTIRDPRDTVLSMREALGNSLDGSIYAWHQAFLSYQRASRPVHLVYFEELVRKPAETVQAMCAFLGVEYEPRMLSFFKNTPAYFQALPHHRRLFRSVDPSVVGKFRQMPLQKIARIEATCAEGMKALGYQFTSSTAQIAVETVPKRLDFLRFLFDRLRYYRLNPERWRRGFFRWKLMLKLRFHYLLTLLPLPNRKLDV
jgi:hypothetical protein